MILIQKINVWEIVAGHWRTLEDDRDGSRLGDVVIFAGVPAAATGYMAYEGVLLSVGAMSVLTNALAIMAGLLFNLLVVLQGLSAANKQRNERVRSFSKNVYDNIAYAIVVSLLSLVPLAIAANVETPARLSFRVACWCAMALVFHFGLTMIMVLKRMYKMLQAEFA
jgi:cytochrome bd-type quinol oxidase subunit 2